MAQRSEACVSGMSGIKLNGMDDYGWKFAMKILLMHEKL
jgi:hypothetical protein